MGPNSEGAIPEENITRLNAIGKWLDVNGEAIYGTQRSGLSPAWGEVVRKDGEKNTVLYLCVYDWPQGGKLQLDSKLKVKSAQMLAGGTPVKFSASGNGIAFDLPTQAPDPIASVIKLELRGKLPAVVLSSNTAKYFEIVDQKD